MLKEFKVFIIFFILYNSLFSSTNLNGKIEYFYMTRLEDSKLVNIPFRVLDLNMHHNINQNFDIFGSVGIEYRNRKDSDFMTDSNLEDFLIDMMSKNLIIRQR